VSNCGLKFIDLFAGCGGLSLGLGQAGLEPVFAIESNSDAFATYKHNLIDGPNKPSSHSWPEDWLPIEPHNIRSIRRAKDRFQKRLIGLRGQVDLVAGGPPCQGYSTLGRRDSGDPRNKLIHDYLWFVEQVRPRFILLENVSGMAAEFSQQKKMRERRTSGVSGAGKLLQGLQKSYAIVSAQVFRAAEFGVPQNRPRLIVIAVHRATLDKKCTDEKLRSLGLRLISDVRTQFLRSKGLSEKSIISCAQAISDLETRHRNLVDYDDNGRFKRIEYGKPRTNYQKLMHGHLNGSAPNSLRLANHRPETQDRFARLHALSRKGEIRAGKNIDRDVLLKIGVTKHYLALLNRDSPSPTISTLPDDVLHYSEPRILTVRENARIQSFPDWFEFLGRYTTGGHRRRLECPRYTQVGNAVAPRFAEFLGQLLSVLDRHLKHNWEH